MLKRYIRQRLLILNETAWTTSNKEITVSALGSLLPVSLSSKTKVTIMKLLFPEVTAHAKVRNPQCP
jgi:hypothetical protein